MSPKRSQAVPDERLDALYRGPLEEFTSARNELAKELRAAGEREAADRVKALRKPTRAAWIVNQLAARRREDLTEALERGEELRDLQEKLLAGKVDRDRLRDAARAEQSAIESLMKTADAIAGEHGAASQVLDRVAETLQAAASDPDVAAAIANGRLEREARATSLGLVGPATPPARTAPKPKRGAESGKAGKRDAERAAKAERAEREARREAAKRRRAAERALAAAAKRIERERGVVERLREDLAERERRVAEAEAEAEQARAQLDELDEG